MEPGDLAGGLGPCEYQGPSFAYHVDRAGRLPSGRAGPIRNYRGYRRPHHLYSRRDGSAGAAGRCRAGGDRYKALRRRKARRDPCAKRGMDFGHMRDPPHRQRRSALSGQGSPGAGSCRLHRCFVRGPAGAQPLAGHRPRPLRRCRRHRRPDRARVRNTLHLHRAFARAGQARCRHRSRTRTGSRVGWPDRRGRSRDRCRVGDRRLLARRMRAADPGLPVRPDRPRQPDRAGREGAQRRARRQGPRTRSDSALPA